MRYTSNKWYLPIIGQLFNLAQEIRNNHASLKLIITGIQNTYQPQKMSHSVFQHIEMDTMNTTVMIKRRA